MSFKPWLNVPANKWPDSVTNHEEAATMGFGAYARDPLTENAIRRDLALSPRTGYFTICPVAGSTRDPARVLPGPIPAPPGSK